MIVVVEFEDGKISAERIYWDRASVLVQVGLLERADLPVWGAEIARMLSDPAQPSNRMCGRGEAGKITGPATFKADRANEAALPFIWRKHSIFAIDMCTTCK